MKAFRRGYKKAEAAVVFKKLGDLSDKRCLEIGAGDGYEASLIKDRFKFFVATEYNKDSFQDKDRGIHYCTCSAEDLPFSDRSFDIIFSSNVIEHIKDRKASLAEIGRVLKGNGIMAHVVPSRTWKVLNILLLYPYLFWLLFNIRELQDRLGEKGKDLNKGNGEIFKYLIPRIHGRYDSHRQELASYGKVQWMRLFEQNGFKITNIVKIPLVASGYEFGFKKIKSFLERKGASSSYVFFMTHDKKETN